MNREIEFQYDEFIPIDFCGQTVAWKMEGSLCELPFEVDVTPTLGEHDFNECEKCQREIETLSRYLTEYLQGTRQKKGFPNCCQYHTKLNGNSFYERNKLFYMAVPEMTVKKVIYTNQFILNNIENENWYEAITEFIDYCVASFGQMPNGCGEPLFRGHYLYYLPQLLSNVKTNPNKKSMIISYFDSYGKEQKSNPVDLQELANTYQNWLSVFPFDLPVFSEIKDRYHKAFPILNGEPIHNKYLGISKVKIHTKESLISALINLTNQIITTLNCYTLYEKGQLSITTKLKLEFILQGRKNKCDLGYIINSTNESKGYRLILNEWLKDEIAFIEQITPIIETLNDQPIITFDEKTKTTIKALNEYKFSEFITSKGFDIDTIYNLLAKHSGNERLPYSIALFSELKYLDYFFKEFTENKTDGYKKLAEILKAQERGVRGNVLVLNPESNENRIQYTSSNYTEIVQKELKGL